MPPSRRGYGAALPPAGDDDDHDDGLGERTNSSLGHSGRPRRDSAAMRVEANDNFKVVIRVRPPAPRELEGDKQFFSIVKTTAEDKTHITILETLDSDEGRGGVYSTQSFTFDRVYDQDAQQRDVYENTARPAVEAVLAGYNSTMIAYGQTGTGKTYTMEGVGQEKGIIPRATEDIFDYISNSPPNRRFNVCVQYMQIYNEVISDLLRPCTQGLSVREGKDRGVYVKQLSSWPVRNAQDICMLMERGGRERVTGNTKMSELSSRSHAIFRIIVCEMEKDDDSDLVSRSKVGQLNIVDLAGSEKVRQTGATGQRLEESKYINKSLSHLGNVIAALTATKGDASMRQHVPYRDSKLTRILEDSLGGNCKTTMIATISPAPDSYTESLSTLKYANRAKNIKNDAIVNEDVGQKGLIKRYERELVRLREQLHDLQKRQLPEGAPGAVAAAGGTPGGAGGEVDPNYADAIHKVSATYFVRLDELERERQLVEEDKATVDRYRNILFQQRNIMIGLTVRLNEREDTIQVLQQEMDAYDEELRMLEQVLQQRTEALYKVSVCGKCRAISAAVAAAPVGRQLSELQKTKGPNGETVWLMEPDSLPQKTAEYDPSADKTNYLSTEDKMCELHGLLQQMRQEIALQPPNLRDRLQEAQEERTALTYVMQERLQSIGQAEATAKMQQLKREVEQWKTRCQSAEENLRKAQYTLDLQSHESQADFNGRLKEVIRKEVAATKVSYEDRIANLQRELDAKEAERRQAVTEGERLQFELFSMRRRYNIPDNNGSSSNMKEFNRLWQKVQDVEKELKKPDRQPFGDVSNALNRQQAAGGVPAAKVAALQQQMQQTEGELDAARQSARKAEEELASFKAASQKEVAQLQRELATHTRDRDALKTIMGSQVKGSLARISNLLQSANSPHASQQIRQQLESEMMSFQNYIDKFLKAIG